MFVEDRRRQVALAVDTAVESDAFPLPNSCRGTAVEIARTLARTLKDARESGIPSDDRFDDILELQLSSGREVEISRKFTLECLSDAQFELSDGTKLENLVVLSMPDYIAPKRSVVHRF